MLLHPRMRSPTCTHHVSTAREKVIRVSGCSLESTERYQPSQLPVLAAAIQTIDRKRLAPKSWKQHSLTDVYLSVYLSMMTAHVPRLTVNITNF